MCLNHPETIHSSPVCGKWSSPKPAPGAKKLENHWSKEILIKEYIIIKLCQAYYDCLLLTLGQAFLVAQLVKNLPAMRETWVQSLGWEDSLEKGVAIHSSILTWRIPWTVLSMELQRVGHNWATFTFRHRTCMCVYVCMCVDTHTHTHIYIYIHTTGSFCFTTEINRRW